MSNLKIHIELDYAEAVQASRMLNGYIRMKTQHQRCTECGADLLLEHGHVSGCSVATAGRILAQMDPPPSPTFGRMIASLWRLRHDS